MPVDTIITNARILIEGTVVEGGVAVEDGKIYAVTKEANLPKADTRIDAHGNILLPGLIDVHVHLRGLDLAYKEDFRTGTSAAAAGGFTTVLDMPSAKPPTNSAIRLRERMEAAGGMIVVNVGFYASFPSMLEEVDEIVRAGAVGFKINPFQVPPSLDIEDDETLLSLLRRAGKSDAVVAVHAENRSLVKSLEERLKQSGRSSIQAYLEAHTQSAEVEDVERMIRLASEADVRVHFSHVSTTQAVSLVQAAKGEGMKATLEATPHNLVLSEDDMIRLGGIAVMDPPLRGRAENERLWKALARGEIDIVASDHAPHSLEEKTYEIVWDVRPGIPGLETTLPVLLTMVNKGILTLGRLIEVLAQNPAKIFRLKGKGFIRSGFDADFTLIDLNETFTVDPSKFYSKGKYSPFEGWKAVGRPVKTLIGGKLVMDRGEILAAPGSGKVLTMFGEG